METDERLILIPDLSSYEILTPAARPGLDENVHLVGWDITSSFFEFELKDLGTSFGLDSAAADPVPSLHFNIEVAKNFVDAFISHLVPMIIAAVVVFLVLLLGERNAKRIKLMRTGTGFTLTMCATLLFVIVFSHIGVRQAIASEDLVYLEYFYIVMYFALLWVAIDSMLLVQAERLTFLSYEDNFIAEVLFWPVILGVLWVATAVTFY